MSTQPRAATMASAISLIGWPLTWLARRRRANASLSVKSSCFISSPFARSIALRAASASPSHGRLERRNELVRAVRLDQVGEHARLRRTLHQLRFGVRSEEQDRHLARL